MTEKITMIELFSGIGAQERALRQLNIPYEITATCDCDKDAVLSYAAMRTDFANELDSYNFPSVEDMISELQTKNVGYDFMKGKHTITTRTSVEKLKLYYLADKLSHNLGDIGKVERLPCADMVTYSFPCTDLSVAGKGEGMQNKCDACGHSWPIDFSIAEEVLVCPNCGEKVSSSTRSGLLGQVQRLLSVAYQNNELPKYLLLENVKNLVGKKFKSQFDAWVKWLDNIGYNTYYEVLNAKHYGIPQNRERIFALSIRKDVDNGGFKFPEKIPLNIRLKDILEKNVDEKYYLPDDRIDKILNSTFIQEKKRIQMKDVCDTLLARDWKDPKCVQVGQLECSFEQSGRVYDSNGISPTIMSNSHGKTSSGYTSPKIMVEEPFIVASRGRNPENPSDRTTGSPTEQRLEPNFSGCTNTLTSVQKDNYVCEPQMVIGSMQANSYIGGGSISPSLTAAMGMGGGQIPMVCYVSKDPIIYDDYNSRISSDQDAINTLTTNCGASAERNGVKILEPIVCEERRDEGIRFFKDDCVGTLRTIDACGDKRVLEPEPQLEFVGGLGEKDWAKDGKKLSRNYPQGSRVYSSEGLASALTAQGVGGAGGYSGLYAVEEEPKNIKWRIRKLTPKCCWRLMGFTDSDYNRAAKYVSASSLYKQAGNSICTCCLVAIFNALFLQDYSTSYADKLVDYNS
jgi:DNA (cytosine-5)-methyltransferase 1